MNALPSRFLLTGANGYLGSWILRFLLEDGHTVRATVRGPLDAPRHAHLHALAAVHRPRLTLHEADLGDAAAFPPLVAGCDYVLHTASPFRLEGVRDPERELVQPAVRGASNVLRAAAGAASVRRVVMTSSVAAICGDAKDRPGSRFAPWTEADWNATSSLSHQPYAFSKTQAERAAWEIARSQRQWDLVVLNPGFMLGPAVWAETPAFSQTFMRRLAGGVYRSGMADTWYALVDVRDVAHAHIRACFTPHAAGRYIVSRENASLLSIVDELRPEFGGSHALPKRKAPKPILWLLAPWFGLTRRFVWRNVGIPVHYDNRKGIRELGLRYTPLAQTLREHFRQVAGAKEVVPAAGQPAASLR